MTTRCAVVRCVYANENNPFLTGIAVPQETFFTFACKFISLAGKGDRSQIQISDAFKLALSLFLCMCVCLHRRREKLAIITPRNPGSFSSRVFVTHECGSHTCTSTHTHKYIHGYLIGLFNNSMPYGA